MISIYLRLYCKQKCIDFNLIENLPQLTGCSQASWIPKFIKTFKLFVYHNYA